MRTYQQELLENNINVEYYELNQNPEKYEVTLTKSILNNKIKKVYFYEIEDKFFETRILNLFKKHSVNNLFQQMLLLIMVSQSFY